MSRLRDKAEEIFRRENPGPHWSIPFARQPKLSDLWLDEQEKYLERAAEELWRKQ